MVDGWLGTVSRWLFGALGGSRPLRFLELVLRRVQEPRGGVVRAGGGVDGAVHDVPMTGRAHRSLPRMRLTRLGLACV